MTATIWDKLVTTIVGVFLLAPFAEIVFKVSIIAIPFGEVGVLTAALLIGAVIVRMVGVFGWRRTVGAALD